jgi:hypothetical protein
LASGSGIIRARPWANIALYKTPQKCHALRVLVSICRAAELARDGRVVLVGRAGLVTKSHTISPDRVYAVSEVVVTMTNHVV